VYLLLGNPLGRTALLVSWILIGVVIGITAGKTGRAIGTSLLVYSISWTLLGLAAFSLIFSLSNLSRVINTSVLGIVPSGTNLYTLTAEPVIDKIYTFFLSSLTSTGGVTPFVSFPRVPIGGQIGSLLDIFVVNVIESLVILLVVSGVTGHFVSRIFNSKKRGPPASGDSGDRNGGTKMASILLVIILMISGLMIFGYGNSTLSPGAAVTIGIHSENVNVNVDSVIGALNSNYPSPILYSTSFLPKVDASSYPYANVKSAYMNYIAKTMASSSSSISSIQADLSFVTGNGDIYNAYGSMEVNNTSSNFLFSSSPFTDSIFSAVIVQDNLSSFSIPLGISGSSGSAITSGLVSLIPNFLFITAFPGNLASTSADARSASSAVSNALDTGSLMEIFSYSTSSNISGINYGNQSITLYIFSSNPSFSQIADLFANSLILKASQNSAAALFSNSLKSGYLTPGISSTSPTTSILAAGMINANSLRSVFRSAAGQSINVSSGNVAFSFGLSFWMNALHSSGTYHNITAARLFDYNSDLVEPQSSDISVIGMGYGNSSSSSSSLSNFNFTLMTNNQTLTESTGFNASSKIFLIQPSSSFNLENYHMQFNSTFTPDLHVAVSSSRIAGDTYRLIVDLRNEDNVSVNSITMNIDQFLSYYNGSATFQKSSGKLYLASLAPGQSHTFTVNMALSGVGTYRLPELVVNYTFMGKHFSTNYGYYEIHVAPPSVAYATTAIVASSLSYAGLGFLGNYIGPLNILEIIVLLLTALAGYIEYRKYRKRRTSIN
ncbi:MAG: hypothetical protein ACP5NK_05870, partial [Thermoplasmata archaeon]